MPAAKPDHLSSKPANLHGGTRAPTLPGCPLTFIHTLGHKWHAHTNKCPSREEMKTCNVFERKKNTDFFLLVVHGNQGGGLSML